MTKQKIDVYHLLIGIVYLVISWIMYYKFGIGMTLFFIVLALAFIASSFFKENKKQEGSKFVIFSYLFVMFSMLFPFTVSIYRKDILEALFVFLMAVIFFILYLKEIKTIKK